MPLQPEILSVKHLIISTLAILISSFWMQSKAQLAVTTGQTAQQLAEIIAGPGVEAFEGAGLRRSSGGVMVDGHTIPPSAPDVVSAARWLSC